MFACACVCVCACVCLCVCGGREYDFESIVSLASLVYGFLACVTAALYLTLRQIEASTPPSAVLCVYGYSLAIFIPASVRHPPPPPS
jgi:hypothetical protein